MTGGARTFPSRGGALWHTASVQKPGGNHACARGPLRALADGHGSFAQLDLRVVPDPVRLVHAGGLFRGDRSPGAVGRWRRRLVGRAGWRGFVGRTGRRGLVGDGRRVEQRQRIREQFGHRHLADYPLLEQLRVEQRRAGPVRRPADPDGREDLLRRKHRHGHVRLEPSRHLRPGVQLPAVGPPAGSTGLRLPAPQPLRALQQRGDGLRALRDRRWPVHDRDLSAERADADRPVRHPGLHLHPGFRVRHRRVAERLFEFVRLRLDGPLPVQLVVPAAAAPSSSASTSPLQLLAGRGLLPKQRLPRRRSRLLDRVQMRPDRAL
jgi:hypothetical protein